MASTNYKTLIDELKRLLPDNRLVKYLDINFHLRVKQNADELISSVLKPLMPKDVSEASSRQTASMQDIIYTPEDIEFKEATLTENINWENVFQPVVIKKDYRIKKITLENFRKFPAIPKDDNESYPYGVSFMNANSQPCSAIILGSNGVGKSSVYESIEYLYRKDIGEARLRDYGRREDSKESAHTRYLTNWNYPEETIKAEMEVMDGGKIDLHSVFKLQHEALTGSLENCFFISEYEVMHYGQMKFEHGGRNSLRMQLAKALDFEEFAWLDRLLFKLSIYDNPKNVADTKYINSQIDAYKLIIEENNKYFSLVELLVGLDMTPADRINFLEKFIERFNWINKIGITTFIQNIITSLTLILQEQTQISKKTASKVGLTAFIKLLRNGNIILDNLKQLQSVYDKIEEESKEIEKISIFSSLRLPNGDLLNNLTQIIKNPFVEAFYNVKNDKVHEMATSSFLYLQDIAAEFIKQIRTMFPSIENLLNERQKQFGWLNSLDEIKNFYKNNSLPQLQNKIKENERLLTAINTLKNEDLTQCNNYKIIHCIRQEAYQIYKLVHPEISSRFQHAVEDVNEKVIQKVMKEFLDEQDISLVWIEDKWDISLDEKGMPTAPQPQYLSCKIKNTKLNEEISVKKYFNTFRYHLFNTILNIALSFAIMKKLEVRLPVVLDDMFYASDFTNRNRISKFVKTILTSYESIFNDDKEIKDKPLQLIIFTHDEMIFKGIWEMIGSLNKENLEESTESLRCNYDFLFYTLLPYQEAEENSDLQINNLTFNFNL